VTTTGEEPTNMPNPLSINISNFTPRPNGSSAVLSVSANGNSNQANWTASDRSYDVSLPATVWNAPPGSGLSFTITQGQTSATYTLKPNAPTGLQNYTISNPQADPPPKVLVEP
jgi:hypothetical protein